jgi:HicB-like protein involved in pilus formation
MSRSTPGAQRADRDPDDAPRYSGRILLRMPSELHAELADRAERDGVSLNQLLTRLLAEGVGSAPRTDSGDGPPRSLRTVLFVNLVLVGILAVAAIVLVVIAIRAT